MGADMCTRGTSISIHEETKHGECKANRDVKHYGGSCRYKTTTLPTTRENNERERHIAKVEHDRRIRT